MNDMQVVILCGGYGARMGEETEVMPKPMIRIGEKPILWHIMKHYAHFGVRDFILTLGYLGEKIKQYFMNYEFLSSDFSVVLGSPGQFEIHNSHPDRGWKVTLADTGLRTLKGGRIKRIEQYITGDRFMLTYGDGVSNVDLDALLTFHKEHGKIGTVTGVHPPSRFGELFVEEGRVLDFSEKPQISTGMINGGFFIFERAIFDYLTPEESCDFEFGPLQHLAADGELMVYLHQGFWECMDTVRDCAHLNKLWADGQARWKIWE